MKILRRAGPTPSGLKNLGPVSAGWLASVGIRKRADLIRLGPVEAFLRVKAAGHKPSLNLLWALAGAERGLRWNRLPEEDRRRLLLELDAAVASHEKARQNARPLVQASDGKSPDRPGRARRPAGVRPHPPGARRTGD